MYSVLCVTSTQPNPAQLWPVTNLISRLDIVCFAEVDRLVVVLVVIFVLSTLVNHKVSLLSNLRRDLQDGDGAGGFVRGEERNLSEGMVLSVSRSY